MVDRSNALLEIVSRISKCQACPLACTRDKTVPGDGNPHATVVWLGEAPGNTENTTGLPFVGRAGQLLTNMIASIGLKRSECYVANIAKCWPPGNRRPTQEEINSCMPFLVEQLNIIKPKVICALGKTAGIGLGLLKEEDSLGPKRGIIYKWQDIPVVLTYHPSYLLRNPGMKIEAKKDLQLLVPYITKDGE